MDFLRPTMIDSQPLLVNKEDRIRLKGHRPAVLWFTGLSAAGKSTISNLVEAALNVKGVHTVMLDGDEMFAGA